MLRASWKSLMARKLRLMMSAFAIVLGVAFVAGSLVFTDTLGRAFTSIMAGSVGDVIVRPVGVASDDTTIQGAAIRSGAKVACDTRVDLVRVDSNRSAIAEFRRSHHWPDRRRVRD